ncbi:DUF4238 domain-containing protein [Nocardia gipuzkoensis]
MSQVAKLHHTVPRFYLRGFADQRERITTVRLPGDKRYTQSIDKTAATNHFYSLDGHSDGRDAFEKALSDMEGDAASVITSIADGVWPLHEKQRTQLGYFLAMQSVRGPDQRRNLGHIAAQGIRLEAQFSGHDGAQRWAKNRFGLDLDEEQAAAMWERAVNPAGPLEVPSQMHIRHMVESAEKLLLYIVGRPWTLVRLNMRSLVTCDAPVGLVPRSDAEPEMGVGFLTAWGITFPVTRKLGLVMSDVGPMVEAGIPVERVRAGEFDHAEQGTTAYAKPINLSTAQSAGECVYHHPDDGQFLPDPLPDPILTTMYVGGEDPAGDIPAE